jgi:hypothetical protein
MVHDIFTIPMEEKYPVKFTVCYQRKRKYYPTGL